MKSKKLSTTELLQNTIKNLQDCLDIAVRKATLMESKYNELAKTYNELLTKWNALLLILRD